MIDEEEATLKRLRKRGASIALEAANPAYETRIFGPDRVRIQGRLVGFSPLLRTLRTDPSSICSPRAAVCASRGGARSDAAGVWLESALAVSVTRTRRGAHGRSKFGGRAASIAKPEPVRRSDSAPRVGAIARGR